MIIYSLTINQGGLLRVTESMFKIFDHLEKDFPLRIIYFSPEPVEELNSNLFIHIKWCQNDPDLLSSEGIDATVKKIKKHLLAYKVERIIYESSMHRYWKHFECTKSLDIHILEIPLYQALIKHKEARSLDDITPDSIYTLITRMALVSMKREMEAFEDSDHLISNSKTTTRDLNEHYSLAIKNKRIDYIPLSTQISLQDPSEFISPDYKSNPQLLYFGRFHPQKGIHFLFNTNWKPMQLTIKGFQNSLINSESFQTFKDKNIQFLEWTSDMNLLSKDLSNGDFILFPSIYEPYGLALTESLMRGKVCIANNNNSGHNEQIVDSYNGYLIDFTKPNFKEIIYKITQKPRVELEKISQNAQKGPFTSEEQRLKEFSKMLREIV